MTSAFITRCFPLLTYGLKEYTPIFEFLFPDWQNPRCPTPTIRVPLPSTVIPASFHAGIGEILGHGADAKFTDAAGLNMMLPVRSPLLLLIEIAVTIYDIKAFLFFAGMNASAILCHNFTALPSEVNTWMWALDVAFTGSSSFNLLLVSLFQPLPLLSAQKSGGNLLGRILSFLGPLVMFAVSIAGIAYKETRDIPFTSEVIYAIMTIIAALFLASRVVVPALHGSQAAAKKKGVQVTLVGKLSLLWATFGILFGVAGLPLDKHVCTHLLQNGYWTEFNGVHILFLGCAIGFHGLLMYSLAGMKHVAAGEKKNK
ncbi:hypothetical protein HDV05_004703 [Chytridiales sp. JEL 0842]|nr:hypothetical protein HDV05_004703 [Chytridiales sp. JEL 0842]